MGRIDWNLAVDDFLQAVDGLSEREVERRTGVSASRYRDWAKSRAAGEDIATPRAGAPRDALLRTIEDGAPWLEEDDEAGEIEDDDLPPAIIATLNDIVTADASLEVKTIARSGVAELLRVETVRQAELAGKKRASALDRDAAASEARTLALLGFSPGSAGTAGAKFPPGESTQHVLDAVRRLLERLDGRESNALDA